MKKNYMLIAHYDFNSTMVRLKVVHFRPLHRLLVFQFHYGTIKREPPAGGTARGAYYFNSTMVRLKEVRV